MRVSKFSAQKFSYLLLGGIFIIVIISMLGCVTQKKCNSKFPPTVEIVTNHTKEIIRKDSILPGSVIREYIPMVRDSLVPFDRWITVTDKKGFAELRYKLDSLGNVRDIECQANSRMVEKLEERITKSEKTTKTPIPVEVKQTPFWNWLIIGGLSVLILVMRFKKFIF